MKKIKLYLKRYKKILILILVFIIIFVCLMIIKISINRRNNNYIKEYSEDEIFKENIDEDIKDVKIPKIYHVDIKGAVKTPGVYAIEEGKRVKDVIDLAGGLTENSDTSLINLAKAIWDEMVIVIYSKEEVDQSNNKFELNLKINDAYQENTESSKIDSSISTSSNDNGSRLININTATKEELMTLSGIGDGKAQAIISYREENGNFTSVEDIMNVSGIGQSTYEKIKSNITV